MIGVADLMGGWVIFDLFVPFPPAILVPKSKTVCERSLTVIDSLRQVALRKEDK